MKMTDTELQRVARQALACLDLTRLNDDDTEADIERLCERAQGRFGPVAAVCVWPRLAGLARRRLPASIAVAAVANFPQGEAKPERAQRDVGEIVQAGAQEVDVVLPWQALLNGDTGAVARVLAATRRASDGLRLKVILETGRLETPARITEASRIALGEGADFLKTSTGKVPVGATPEAARAMLQAIAADARRTTVGFKASGGVRSVADAALYLGLVTEHLGQDAGMPARFRIGASGLLDDIEAVLAGHVSAPAGGGY
ncbi:deoxyribose-phosphate aldolase [Ideonella sp.]|uniref:deoxyribose-phosphate aldolase n=1 Tax=Ideonella sp. TaxID=1929293 RepID=UPI0035AF732A